MFAIWNFFLADFATFSQKLKTLWHEAINASRFKT